MESSDEMFQQHKRARVRWKILQAIGVGWGYFAPASALTSLVEPRNCDEEFREGELQTTISLSRHVPRATQSQKLVRILCTTNAEMKLSQLYTERHCLSKVFSSERAQNDCLDGFSPDGLNAFVAGWSSEKASRSPFS
jgi:hypothetical protein